MWYIFVAKEMKSVSFNINDEKTVRIKPIAGIGQSKLSAKTQGQGKTKQLTASLTVKSAVECMLKSETDMFESACTIRDLMVLEHMSIEDASKVLGADISAIRDKLLLLDLTSRERKFIKKADYSECTAIAFAKLDKDERKKALKLCKTNGYNSVTALNYAISLLKNKSENNKNENGKHNKLTSENSKVEISKTPENQSAENISDNKSIGGKKAYIKGNISDMGLLYNSLDRVISIAKNAGVNIEKQKVDIPDGVEVVIRVHDAKKRNKHKD